MAAGKIVYIGFGQLIKSLESGLTADPANEFSEILQLSPDVLETSLDHGDVFLIGPYTIDAVRQVQRATQKNPLISVVVLVFPDQFQKVKQAVQFAYNVTKHITLVSYDVGKDISTVIDNAVMRSQQRKSFLRNAEQQHYPKTESPVLTLRNLNAFLENSPMGAIVFDQHRRTIGANQKAKILFHPKLSGRSTVAWQELFPDEPAAWEVFAAAENTDPVNEVIRVNNHFLEINISPLKAEDGMPNYLLLLNDITDKIKAENRLQSKVAELEFLNQELDQFINVVSHDFKTPLTSIALLAELGERETDPEKLVGFLKQIRLSSGKLRELLKGLNVLVDVTKSKSEKLEQVDLAGRLNIVLTDFQPMLEEYGATLRVDFSQAPEIGYFTAHIDSLFSNLITNAIKYRNLQVPLVIEVSSRAEKDYTILSVKDNGNGIDLARNMNKLFQPFKRLTDQGTGTGLGLSIVKRLIEKNQGYLEVFSQPGEGTEFKAYLKTPA